VIRAAEYIFALVNNSYITKKRIFFSWSFSVAEIFEETDFFVNVSNLLNYPLKKHSKGDVLAWLCEDLQTVC